MKRATTRQRTHRPIWQIGRQTVWQGLSVIGVALILGALPALAEAPPNESTLQNDAESTTLLEEPADRASSRQENVRQLILFNECMGCDLEGVTLTEAHLIGADLRGANLQGSNLSNSNLEGADLSGANLTGANLSNTFLTNADLSNTQLDGVNFSYAHLYSVNVTNASTDNLNLTGAELFDTPIYIGGDEQPLDEPLEPMIPFEEIYREDIHPEDSAPVDSDNPPIEPILF